MISEILEVAVNERLLGVETEGNDVAGVVQGILHCVLAGQAVVEDGLLVIRQHEDQRHVETLLQPLGKLHGNGVSKMQAASAWTSPGVEKEGLAALVGIEDLVEVAMTEEEPATEPAVGFSTSDPFETLEKSLVDRLRVPFPSAYQLVATTWTEGSRGCTCCISES